MLLGGQVTLGGGGTFGWLLGSGTGTDTGSAPFEMMQWPAASEEKSNPSWHIGSCWVAEMLVSLREKDTVPAKGSLFSFACTSNVRQLSSKARKTKGSFTSPPFLLNQNINFNHMLLGLPQSGGGVDFRSERVLAQLHQVSPKTDCYGRRVGDLHIPGDDQRAKAMKTLYHLLCLVVCHAVDPDGVDPRSGEVLAAEDR